MPNPAELYQEYSDEDLADLVVLRDYQAFTILVQRHTTNFYRTSYLLTDSKTLSENVVQDCFLKFWEFPKKWDVRKNVEFTTWFKKTTINKSYNISKKKKPYLLKSIDVTNEKLFENLHFENHREDICENILNNALEITQNMRRNFRKETYCEILKSLFIRPEIRIILIILTIVFFIYGFHIENHIQSLLENIYYPFGDLL